MRPVTETDRGYTRESLLAAAREEGERISHAEGWWTRERAGDGVLAAFVRGLTDEQRTKLRELIELHKTTLS